MASSLFGPTPAELMLAQQKELQQEQLLRNQQIMQQGAEFGPFRGLYQAGLRFGDIGSQAINQSLFPQQADPRLQQATAVQSVLSKYADQDQTDPNVLAKIGRDLMPVAPDAGIKALTLAQTLTKEKKLTTVAPGATVLNERGEVVFTAPDKEAIVKPSTNFSEVGAELGFGAKPSLADYTQDQARQINTIIQQRKENEKKAGVAPGELKVSDVASGRSVAEDIFGRDKSKLTTVGEIKTYISQIRKDNPAAVPQLRRSLAKLVGDSQIGQNEVNQALGSSGFAQNIIEGFNTFLTGQPTNLKLDQIDQAVTALEDYYGNRFNKGRESARTILYDTKLPKSTVDNIIGNPYTTSSARKASQFVNGQVYVDAQGNRARYNNGKWEPLK